MSASPSFEPNPAEEAEVERLLALRELQRAPNLHRILAFLCKMHFEGRDEEIKEYTIAVQALGRPSEFDPQIDPIVRVGVSNLRKRLEAHYASMPGVPAIQLQLPVGQYVPLFVHASSGGLSDLAAAVRPSSTFAPALNLWTSRRSRILWAGGILFLAALLGVYGLIGRRGGTASLGRPTNPPFVAGPEFRMAVGASSPYVDSAGRTWMPDQGCEGGKLFHHPERSIQGTQDPELFRRGRLGSFQCKIPVPQGLYEMHLLFSDGFGSPVSRRKVNLQINGEPIRYLDIVDEAEGPDLAVTKIYTDVQPQADGFIHLTFFTGGSFLNAVEVVPGRPGRMRALRLTAAPSPFRDSRGQTWLPDQYFRGGSPNRLQLLPHGAEDPGLFQYEHLGHCRYVLPVALGQSYTVRLYFTESWFGLNRMVAGGPGSRVFQIQCNGETVFRDFDILRRLPAGKEVLVETLSGVRPTRQGMIELTFMPQEDYPVVNAIEVISEGPAN